MLEKKILQTVIKIEKLHPEDDYALYKLWDELTELLSVSEKETISFLRNCKDKNIIETVSSVFEDVAFKLQSKKYIEFLEYLEKNNPNLKQRVKAAKDAMLDE